MESRNFAKPSLLFYLIIGAESGSLFLRLSVERSQEKQWLSLLIFVTAECCSGL